MKISILSKLYDRRLTLARPLTDLFLLISLVFVVSVIIQDYAQGGQGFRQGDWLINNHGEIVRRGIFGSGIIFVSDTLQINPLLSVCILQVSLLVLLFVSYRMVAFQTKVPFGWILLIFSPAMFPIFWVADADAIGRKELIAFTGLSLAALGALRRSSTAYLTGVALLGLGFFAHEALVLFFPIFIVMVYASGFHVSHRKHVVISMLILLFCVLVSIFYAASFPFVGNASAVCAPLLDRGLSENICSGAIMWLGLNMSVVSEMLEIEMTARNLGQFFLGYSLSTLPLIYLAWIGNKKFTHVVLVVALSIPFLPLYFIALDWGRWMSFHVFSASLILACFFAKDQDVRDGHDGDLVVLSFATFSLLFSPYHMIGISDRGALRRLARALLEWLPGNIG